LLLTRPQLGHSAMTIELPVFRLGLGGFSPDQEQLLRDALKNSASAQWLASDDLAGADGWWLNGSRVQLVGEQTIRVGVGGKPERSLDLYIPDVDRPLAFSQPIALRQLRPTCTFNPASAASLNSVLDKFEARLSPLAAQFCLASQLVEQQAALGAGVFDVILNGALVAVVDMRGEVGVLPTTGPADFEQTAWRRRAGGLPIPGHFARTSLSQLMWQYAVRTQRDILPRHYRAGPLYFRRPPRLPQRLLKDSHLLLMRELAQAPATFQALLHRTGLDETALAQDLAALYFVGSVTANPRRAAVDQRPHHASASEHPHGQDSDPPSAAHSVPHSMPSSVPPSVSPVRPRPVASDLTAPAPLRFS
jgi:hypothetical protein